MGADDRASSGTRTPKSAVRPRSRKARTHYRKHPGVRLRDRPPRPFADEVAKRFYSAIHLVEYNARQAARRMRSGGLTVDDLASWAREGLLRAARTFDPSRGVPFPRWANRRIHDHIAEGVRRWAHLPRGRGLRRGNRRRSVESARADGAEPNTSREDFAALCRAIAATEAKIHGEVQQAEHDPEYLFAQCELTRRLHEAIARLTPIQRELIERHDLDEEPLPELARSLGISTPWASRLRQRAIERLRRELDSPSGGWRRPDQPSDAPKTTRSRRGPCT